jgi:hypothetical protein
MSVFVLAAITFSLAVRAQAQTETVLYNFGPGWAGDYPDGTVVLDGAGNIYGSTQFGANCCGTVYELSPVTGGGWTYKVLKGFGNSSYGSYVAPTLTRDAAGNLYGTTINGGNMSVNCNGPGCGVVFQLSPESSGPWSESVLHTFSGGPDGGNPFGSLLLGPDGSIYGTTTRGGNDHQCTTKYVQGCGVVFRLSYGSTTGWRETVLYTFSNAVGSGPNGGLAMDAAGNLYGTTQGNAPILFELTPTSSGPWTETTLVNFLSTSWGSPVSGVIADAAGNLYGTAYGTGGECPIRGACGVVFELSPIAGGGWTQTVLHTFTAGTDFAYPFNVSMDTAGNLYGVAIYGYSDTTDCGENGCGGVFKLSPSGGTWTETILHKFVDGADGNPNGLSGVAVDASGNVFGTAAAGGNITTNCGDGCGVIFEITP